MTVGVVKNPSLNFPIGRKAMHRNAKSDAQVLKLKQLKVRVKSGYKGSPKDPNRARFPSEKGSRRIEGDPTFSLRQRVYEFLGLTSTHSQTCKTIIATDRAGVQSKPQTLDALNGYILNGFEISRSLWDDHFLIAHLDIEYVNFDFPGEAYLNPGRTFGIQQPVVQTTESILHRYGISALHILSGRGHHFIWQISQGSQVFNEMVEIGEGAPSCDLLVYKDTSDKVPPKLLVEAFAGLGLVMEMLAHEIKEAAAPLSDVPVELTATEVGPGECGREMVSIDISEYGDPLQSRAIRVPFSSYLKPWQQKEIVGDRVVETLSPLFLIPLKRLSLDEALEIRRDPKLVAKWARHTSSRIPVQESGMAKLTAAYLASSLRIFHDVFYSQRHEPPSKWPETYDLVPRESLPLCMQMVIDQPNDLLLRPWGMRLVTRVLLSLGWHPRHIAGLIRSKFERDYNWGTLWEGYNPAMRADFYARIFAGIFMVWRDDLVDFNCQSFKEEGTCPFSNCSNNLDWYRQSAMSRRRYGHLAHRPFNRLFLSKEHL